MIYPEFISQSKSGWPTCYGYEMQQSLESLYIIKKILDDNPDILRIVELGTANGGTALFFGACISERGGLVLTVDQTKLMTGGYEGWIEQAQKLNVSFLYKDNFTPDAVQYVKDFIGNNRAMIFCDDGDKKREVALYCKILKPNDLLLAHDYENEFFYNDLTIELINNYEFYRQNEFPEWHKTLCTRRK